MISTIALAPITSHSYQHGSREIRKVRMWGSGVEKQEGPGNKSVKEQIVKVAGFADCTVSVKSCSNKSSHRQ